MNPDDNDLSSLLQGWRADVEPDTGFHRSVWARIEAAESRKGAGLSTLFSWVQLLAIPRIAVTTAAIALFGGILIGGAQARSAQEGRYLLSLKPSAASTHLH
jgi:hypothetical protein